MANVLWMTLPTSDTFMHVLTARSVTATFEIKIVAFVVGCIGKTIDWTGLNMVLNEHQP